MNDYKEYKDEELICRLRAGESAIEDYLLEKYKPFVKSKSRALFLVGGDKEDLIQEGMIGLFKAIREYKQERNDSFTAFAALCITRQMYSAIKSSNTKKNLPLNTYISFDAYEVSEDAQPGSMSASAFEIPGYWQKDPEESVIDRESAVRVEEEMMARLSSMEREVLAYYTSGMPYQHIATVMGKEPKSIDNALQRIRKKLKTVLAIKDEM